MTIYVLNEGHFKNYNDAVKYQKKTNNAGYIFATKDGYTIRIKTFYAREKAFEVYDKVLDKKTYWLEEIKN